MYVKILEMTFVLSLISLYLRVCLCLHVQNKGKMDIPVKIFDAHLHFWDLNVRKTYPNPNPSFDWPNNSTPLIYKSFLPEESKNINFNDAVFVQALNKCPEEIEWVQDYFHNTSAPYIKGIVGGLDLTKPNEIRDLILKYQSKKCPLVGIRHIIDADEDPIGFFKEQNVLRSLEIINNNFPSIKMDLVLRPHNLYLASTLASQFTSMQFMIDHIAKPQMSSDGLSSQHKEWMREIENASNHKNVFVKLSGLITEVDVKERNNAAKIIRPFTDFVIKHFGTKRCVFGSDWPVSIDSGYSYENVIALANNLLLNQSSSEKEDIFYNNGVRFYGILND